MTTPANPLTKCANCDAAILPTQNYCANCGQKACTPRLTLHEIGEEFVHALAHVDRSVLSLIRQLLVNPGFVALEYVSGRRKRYFGPFAFLVVTVAFSSAVFAISGFQVVAADSPNTLVEFLQHHVNLLVFADVPILAAFCRLVGFSERFNYAEYLVLASYTGGIHMLFYSLIEVPVWYVFRADAEVLSRLFYVSLAIGPLYFAYGMYQFLPGRRFSSIFKALLASLLTRITVNAAVGLLANLFS